MSSQLSFFAPARLHDGVPLRSGYHVRGKIHGKAVEVAAEIKQGTEKAAKQDLAVLEFFRANPGRWSPSQVWQRVGPRWPGTVLDKDGEMVRIGPRVETSPMWPLTSVRRAITNLTERGLLRFTAERRGGLFGRPEHVWELVPAEVGYREDM